MNFWKKIFRKSKYKSIEKENINEISPQFHNWVKTSINLIGSKEGWEMGDGELHRCLIQNGILENDAWEIIIFLPIAFCRKMFPEINWLPEYEETSYSKTKKIKRRYKENRRYVIIEEESNIYWNENPEKEVLLNIVKRSAEFNAISKLLKDGGTIDDIMLTRTCIIRNN